MLPGSNQFFQEFVIEGIQFLFRFSFQFSILRQSVRSVCQSHFQLHCTLAGLAAMGLIHNNRKGFACRVSHKIVNDREFLKCRDNNPFPVIDRFQQIFGALLFVNQHHAAQRMVEAVDGILQLTVQYFPVRNNND